MSEIKSVYKDDETHFQLVFEKGIDLRNRVINISTELEDVYDCVDAAMTEFEAKDASREVIVRLKCCGGSAHDAMAIVGRLQSSSCTIITEGFGMVMSAATIILACGNTRRISRFAEFLWHHGSIRLPTMAADRVSDEAKAIDAYNKLWSETMASFSRSPKGSTRYWYNLGKKDARLTPEQLLELGVVDEII